MPESRATRLNRFETELALAGRSDLGVYFALVIESAAPKPHPSKTDGIGTRQASDIRSGIVERCAGRRRWWSAVLITS
jgi:hypothetical protein